MAQEVTVDLHLGDLLKILPTLPAGKFDAVIVDPPYSSGGMFANDRSSRTSDKYVVTGTQIQRPEFAGDTRDQRGWAFWLSLWLSECLRVAKSGAVICLFSDWRQLPMASDVLQAGGWVWRGIVPWNKTRAARPQKGRFRYQCEYILWGTAGPFVEQVEECLPGFYTYVVRSKEKRHMTGKPLALLKDLLRITRPGALVLDPLMGSGSTGVACVEMGRSFVGIEIDPVNYAEAQAWIEGRRLQGILDLGRAADGG